MIADDQRAQRERTPREWRWAGGPAWRCASAAVRVQTRRASVAALRRARCDGARAEQDQHRRDGELEGVGQRRRHLRGQRREDEAGPEQRRRMPDAPERAQQRAAPRARRVGRQHGDGGEVIGIERVARAHRHPEQQSDERSRHACRLTIRALARGAAKSEQ